MTTESNELSRIQALIHAASALAGSQGKLARAMGYDPAHVSEWTHGKRSCPIAAQALMAEMTGLDAEAVALYAVIAQERNPQRREHLVRVLGKGFKSTSAAAFSAISASALWASDSLNVLYTMYRTVKSNLLYR